LFDGPSNALVNNLLYVHNTDVEGKVVEIALIATKKVGFV